MPWDNGVNKKAHIHADNSTVLVEQFPFSKMVEWAALIIDRIGIISHNRNVSVGIHKPIKTRLHFFKSVIDNVFKAIAL